MSNLLGFLFGTLLFLVTAAIAYFTDIHRTILLCWGTAIVSGVGYYRNRTSDHSKYKVQFVSFLTLAIVSTTLYYLLK